MKKQLMLQDIIDAEKRIRPYIFRTPLLRTGNMDEDLKCRVYLKPEMLQVSGAFKMRGAVNALFSLTEEQRERGIICSSSGNHGKACALAGRMTGTHVVVVLPEDAPKAKADGIRALGGEVIFGPRLYSERWNMVKEEERKHGYTIVHGYEDYPVMAGQGTLGLEILEDLPYVDTILVPVGGGGLISGVAVAVKSLRPNVQIIGVQARASEGYVRSLHCGYPVEVEVGTSLADGLTCRRPGTNPFPIIQKYVDDCVSVSEDSIAEAVRLIADKASLIAEPSAAVGVAAILEGMYQPEREENVVLILTSGNWDMDKIGKILNHEHVEGSI